MKHAYLILAHHNPVVLQHLIAALDDLRNDIYVHIDRKASFDGSELQTLYSNLFVIENRIDARWGDFSLVEAEMLLFERAAKNENYAYYHLLSGVDMPIKTQDYIHECCNRNQGVEFVGFSQNASPKELKWRSQHYFLFSKDFCSKNIWKRGIRMLYVWLQNLISHKRSSWEIKKGSQWCSITHDFVVFLLSHKDIIRKDFSATYCPDEMVIQTLCWNSEFRNRAYSLSNEFVGCKRYIKWKDGALLPIIKNDIDDMLLSDKWFARKFENCDFLFEELMSFLHKKGC
ncbi:MAG: beta-1,6-N-acetylglucosaminyltransferase [Bacteroides sp.]|nr:beta-1,6-N-acetylglucosaminyltransferase [Bacteroides sp.]